MKEEKDYKEFLELLNKHKVRYCIIGSYAVAFYSRPRYTKDIDILVEPAQKNAEKIMKVLNDFGFGSLELKAEDFLETGNIIQLGYEPVRIDILTSIEKIEFAEIWKTKKIGNYGDIKVNFIDLDKLIESKKISNRKQDIADIESLLKLRKKEN